MKDFFFIANREIMKSQEIKGKFHDWANANDNFKRELNETFAWKSVNAEKDEEREEFETTWRNNWEKTKFGSKFSTNSNDLTKTWK